MITKCPKCEKLLTTLTINALDAHAPDGRVFRTIALVCPYCQTALGAQIDPIAIQADTVDMLMERLSKKGR